VPLDGHRYCAILVPLQIDTFLQSLISDDIIFAVISKAQYYYTPTFNIEGLHNIPWQSKEVWLLLCSSRVFKNRVLRKVFGCKRDEVTGQWRRLGNGELMIRTHRHMLFG